VAKKFKSQPSAGKIMLRVFWGIEGVILVNVAAEDPDPAPRDFHMFCPMKEALRGRRFSSDEEVIGAVQNRLKTQQKKTFFSDGIKELVKRWDPCVEVERGQVEKQN
jgi:hypothetical protein